MAQIFDLKVRGIRGLIRRQLTHWYGFAMNLICPATIISQSFDCGHQINKICHEKHFARVQSLQGLEINDIAQVTLVHYVDLSLQT